MGYIYVHYLYFLINAIYRYNADLHKLDKEDPSYGQPDSTSLSAKRAKDGEAKMRREICDICDAIYHHGRRSDDGKAVILFGHLFTVSWSKDCTKLIHYLIKNNTGHKIQGKDGRERGRRKETKKWKEKC